jgi:putative transposase
MPLRSEAGTAGLIFHVMNRGVRRLRLFDSLDDYQLFLMCLEEGRRQHPVRIFSLCVMPNHFHLVVQPTEDFQLSAFMKVATGTHAKRWNSGRQRVGQGAVYQGRYRAFPMFTDAHFLRVCRYVERNPLRAGLVPRAEGWLWSSLNQDCRKFNVPALDPWPILQPEKWVDLVNETETAAELDQVRNSVANSIPFGPEKWATAVAAALQLRSFPRRPGRPRKE